MKYLVFLPIFLSFLFADDGFSTKADVAPVNNQLYIKECGSCHFPYQAGLLPANAWNKMMANLENHFNSDASLSPENFQTISKYLNANSAEKTCNIKEVIELFLV